MNFPLYPCLWFDGEAKAAAEFYCSIFQDARITVDTPMVVNFEISGQKIMGLNGGPDFRINPSISFFVVCESEEETQRVWDGLLEGGMVMMALDKYDWSEKYGWLQDKYGLTWQIALGKLSDTGGQKLTPSLLFVGEQHGKAEEALNFYTSVFKNSSIEGILHYKEGEHDPAGTVKHAQFSIDNYVMMVMDSAFPHAFQFNEAVSFVIPCKKQEEIDYYWNKLSEGGHESMCGWLQDKFGVWWQVIPANLGQLMSDPERGQRVTKAFMKMRKFDIEVLENA